MINKIREKIDDIFSKTPPTKRVQDLKEELVGNLEAKYNDLIEIGKTPKEAYDIVIASIGDINELMDLIEPTNPLDNRIQEAKYKKKFKITELCLWFLGVMILLASMTYFINKTAIGIKQEKTDVSSADIKSDSNEVGTKVSISNMNAESEKHVKEETIQLDGIDVINMKLESADVEVSFVEGDEMRVVESINDKNKNELFEMSQSGDTLNILKEEEQHIFSFGNSSNHKIEVFIPISFNKKLVVKTSSGDVKLLNSTYLKELKITTTSGVTYCEKKIEVSESSISSTSGGVKMVEGKGNFAIQSSSGDIDIEKLEGDGNIETTSGTVAIGSMIDGKMDIKTSSGEVSIKALEGYGKIRSTSGEIRVDIIRLQGDMMLNTSSGKVDIRASKEVNAGIEIETSSGEIDDHIEINYIKDGNKAAAQFGDGEENTISIETSSGDIMLRQG